MSRTLALALVAVAFTHGLAQAENVVLYTNTNEGGAKMPFDDGEVGEMGRGWNDEVSSIWIRNGYSIEGYQHINFQGVSFRLEARSDGRIVVNPPGFPAYQARGGWVVNIDKNYWNDELSSYRVKRLR